MIQQVSQGRKMTFARLVGLSAAMVGDWFYHQQLPSVENLLRVCFAVHLSLQDLFMEKQIICSLRSEGTQELWSSHHRQAPRGFWKSSQVRETLEAIARNEEIPPPSLKAVARQVGCSDPHSLQISHPVPSQMISDRYAAYMDAKKLATEQQHCKDVQNAVRQLIEQDIPPTGRNVALILSKPGILRSSVVREARRAAIREREGYNMENRYKESPKKAKSVAPRQTSVWVADAQETCTSSLGRGGWKRASDGNALAAYSTAREPTQTDQTQHVCRAKFDLLRLRVLHPTTTKEGSQDAKARQQQRGHAKKLLISA